MPGTIEHWKRHGFLSTLPDLFMLVGKAVPPGPVKRFCFRMHNTEEGVSIMRRVGLDKAWKDHMQVDMKEHSYSYDYSDLVPRKSIMLLSGGLDSFIQWRLLGQPLAIYFRIGHKAEEREIKSINTIRQSFGGEILIDDSLKLGKHEFDNGYIPYRNLLFITVASIYMPNVIISQIAEWAPDKNQQFYRRTEKLLSRAGKGHFQGISIKPRVHSPFSHMTKTQLVREYLKRHPVDDLAATVSCYSGQDKNCGKCNACISRYMAMKNNGIEEEYLEVPTVSGIKNRVSIVDFSVRETPMYLKRWKEFREFRKKSK